MKLRPDTLAVHGSTPKVASGSRKPRRPFDAIPMPIVTSTTFAFENTQEIRDHFEGRIERDEYGRYGTPSARSVERVLASLEAGEDAAVFSSGMAAITTALLALLKSGDHVILTADGYRRTRQFVTNTLTRYGVTSTIVEPSDVEGLAAAIVPGQTRVVLTEAPSNPYLRVPDVPAIAALCKAQRGVKLLVDATFATPINGRPLEWGADLVIHSGTKYLGGHNDVLAGGVVGASSLVSLVREMRGVLGGVLDAHAAYLLERGMRTLGLRVRRQNESALLLASRFEHHPAVRRMFYPGLSSHPDHAVAQRLLSGFGGVVTFELASLEAASTFVDALRIATIAPSLGGVETLVEQPALMSFYELTSEERAAIGVPDGLVRLSIGVEDADDLGDDVQQALDAAQR